MGNLGIHILNRNTGDIEAYLTNNSKVRTILDNVHKRNADDHSETFDFTTEYKHNNDLTNENRLLIPDEKEGRFREFIIKEKEDVNNLLSVSCDAAFLTDLNKNSEPLLPMNFQNVTVDEAVTIALARTGYEKGNIQFDGFVDLVTTEPKTPYQLLLMIEEMTGLVIDFYVLTSGNEITSRRVAFHESRDISEFTGKEFVVGKDIETIKRKESTRELATAILIASTDAKGKPLYAKVYDKQARDRWNGDTDKYSWTIYNLEATEKDKMTVEKMKVIGEKVLKKMTNSVNEYEVDAVQLIEQTGENAEYLDKVRVRDVVYSPHLYAEAVIKGIERDIFDDSTKKFTLGSIKTYKESDLRKYFASLSSKFQAKLNDNITTVAKVAPEAPAVDKLWLDINTQPGILKRWNGDAWIIDSATKPSDVKAVAQDGPEVILGGNMKFEADTGTPVVIPNDDGTTTTVYEQTKNFSQGKLVWYDPDGNMLIELNNERSFFQDLAVQNFSVANLTPGSILASKSLTDKVFYVHANPTPEMEQDDTYNGSSETKPLPFTKMVDQVPNILNHTYTFIVVEYDAGDGTNIPTDHVLFSGISGDGNIIINTNRQVIGWTMCISKSTIQFYVNGEGTVLYNPDSAEKAYAIQNYGSTYMEVLGISVMSTRYSNLLSNGSYEEFDGIRTVYNGYSHIEGNYIEGFRDGIYVSRGHNAYCKDNNGIVNRYGTSSYYASKATLLTTGVSSLQVGKSTQEYYGGEVVKFGTVAFPNEPTVDSTKTSEPPAIIVKKRTWDALQANNYYGSYWVTSGELKGKVMSGRWPGWQPQRGIWLFSDSMRSTLNGKTIKKVTVNIGREGKYGWSYAVPVYLRMHKYTTTTGFPSGVPAMSDTYKIIKLAQIDRKTFDVTAAFKSMINDGTWSGFGLRSPYDDDHYGAFSSNMKITVEYY